MSLSCCRRNTMIKKHSSQSVRIVVSALLFMGIAGCTAVGPDYVVTEGDVPDAWHTDLGHGLSAETSDPQELADWWTKLEDPILTDLIEQAVRSNLDLKQAMAKVREARGRRGISQAGQFPTLDASGSASRSQEAKTVAVGRHAAPMQ